MQRDHGPRNHVGISSATISALALAMFMTAPAAYAQEARRQFDVPAQPLSRALLDFGRQAKISIAAPRAILSGKTSAPVSGEMTTREGLGRLLQGSGLDFQFVNPTAVQVTEGARKQPVSAQEGGDAASASDPAVGLEEVVVTARRREESNQRVPISITAITGADIETKHITTAQDLQQSVPSLAVYSFGVRDGTTYTLRGQGTTLGAAQGVVAYLNEVPLPTNPVSSSNGGGPGLYLDLASLAVLNGPQGTLFGRNTTGGAILIQPNMPVDKLEGYLQVALGNYNDQEYEALFNAPLIDDKLLVRVVARRQARDGFTHNIISGQKLDNRDNWAGRITLSFRPTDTFRDDVMFYGTSTRSNGTGGVITLVNPNPALLVPALYSGLFGTPSIQQALNEQNARGIRSTANDAPTNEATDYWGIINTLRWDLTGQIAVKSISAYQVAKSKAYFDTDATAIPIVASLSTGDMATMSQELQLQGASFSKHLQWTLGGYAEYDHPRGPQYLNSYSFGDTLIPPSINNSVNASRQRSRALYAQASYNLGGLAPALEGLNVTGGYRYTWDFRSDSTQATTPEGLCLIGAPPSCTFAAQQRSKAGTWTVGLDYQVDPDTFVYVKASRGYKGGGFNLSSLDPNYTTFKPEYVKDVEAGLKRDWNFDVVKVRTNITVFHTDYTDIQKTIGIIYNNVPSSVTSNVAAAKIDGVEFSGTIMPSRYVTLGWSYSYLDARYTKSTSGFDISLPFYFTPKQKFSLSGTVRLPIDEGFGRVSLSANYGYTSKLFSASVIEPGAFIPAYGLLSLTADWTGVAGRPVDAGLFVTNATNEKYRIAGFSAYSNFGFSTGVFGEPRMYGVRVRYRWDAE